MRLKPPLIGLLTLTVIHVVNVLGLVHGRHGNAVASGYGDVIKVKGLF